MLMRLQDTCADILAMGSWPAFWRTVDLPEQSSAAMTKQLRLAWQQSLALGYHTKTRPNL